MDILKTKMSRKTFFWSILYFEVIEGKHTDWCVDQLSFRVFTCLRLIIYT